MNKELFLEHYEIKQKYYNAKNEYDKLIEKKAMLVISTQPRATNFDKELIKGGTPSNKFELLVEQLEKLDPEIISARNDRDLQEYFLKKKEIELSNSDDVLDRIYYLKYVKHYKVRNIAINVNYSRMQTYRLIEEINEKIKDVTKCYN